MKNSTFYAKAANLMEEIHMQYIGLRKTKLDKINQPA